MTDKEQITQLRLRVLANGYSPLRNFDKRCFMPGWPSVEITEAEINSWARRHSRDTATGIRVENGLAVIDIDIDDQTLVDKVANAILDIAPQLENPNVPLLVRKGKGFKEAWFVRTAELFSRIHSRAWTRPGAMPDDPSYRVEIFGGAVARQFGSFGPHTIGDDGVVAVQYTWTGASPADTPQSELPVLTKAQFFAICDAAEAILEAAGWKLVEKSTKGENDVERVYDLTEDMQFDIDTGERVSLQRLRELAGSTPDGAPAVRCSAAFAEGPSAKRTDRCIVSLTRAGHVAIWESASGVTHCEASAKPRDFEVELNRVAERLKEIDAKRRNKISSADGAVVAAQKLLNTYAYCPKQTQCVVPLWATSIDDGYAMPAMRLQMMPNCDVEIGPRGGTTKINPIDIWLGSPQRVSVEGLRMRPDQPRPTFEEHGKRWVNAYAPPDHGDATGGSAELGLAFMEQIAPDAAERAWFMQWLAFKYRYPHIPGPAVVLVAHGRFGTGRGTLTDLMKKLFGSSYVREMSYDMVAGRTYQSQYTDWAADKLMIVVSESSETDAGGSTYAAKQNTYEHLKSMVEVNMVERTFISKTRAAFTAMACASTIIATNHMDALPIPEGDRRFGVLGSGEPREPEYWERLRRWMDHQPNIAAFAAALLAVDLAGYSPYAAPPMTESKRAMVDSSKSDLDRAIDLAIANMPFEVMVLDQVIAAIRQGQAVYGFELPDRWQAIARKVAAGRLFRVGVFEGTNWQVQIEGRKYAVYAKTDKGRIYWKSREHIREEILKNGSPTATGLPGNILTGLFKDKSP